MLGLRLISLDASVSLIEMFKWAAMWMYASFHFIFYLNCALLFIRHPNSILILDAFRTEREMKNLKFVTKMEDLLKL